MGAAWERLMRGRSGGKSTSASQRRASITGGGAVLRISGLNSIMGGLLDVSLSAPPGAPQAMEGVRTRAARAEKAGCGVRAGADAGGVAKRVPRCSASLDASRAIVYNC